MSYVLSAVDFLVSIILDWFSIIFLLALILYRYRLLLISNPVYSLLVRFTRFPVGLVPRTAGSERERISFILMVLAAQCLKSGLLMFMNILPLLSVYGWLLLSMSFIFKLMVQIYMFSILILVLLSWLAPARNVASSPVVDVLLALTEPLMRRLRQHIPVAGGLDFTPIIAIVLLYLVLLLVYNPLSDYALSLR